MMLSCCMQMQSILQSIEEKISVNGRTFMNSIKGRPFLGDYFM